MLRRVLSCRAMPTTCYAQLVEPCQGEGGTRLETTTRSYMQHQPQKCNKQLLQTKKHIPSNYCNFCVAPFFFQKPYKNKRNVESVVSCRVVSCRVKNMLLRDGRVVSCQLNTLLRKTCRVETYRGMSCRRCRRVGEVKVFFHTLGLSPRSRPDSSQVVSPIGTAHPAPESILLPSPRKDGEVPLTGGGGSLAPGEACVIETSPVGIVKNFTKKKRSSIEAARHLQCMWVGLPTEKHMDVHVKAQVTCSACAPGS